MRTNGTAVQPLSSLPAVLVAGAALLLVASLARPVRAQPLPHAHTVSTERLGVWEGYTLRGHRIAAAFVSDAFRRPSEEGYAERVELDVVGPAHRWSVRCTTAAGRFLAFSMVCDLLREDGVVSATLLYGAELRGLLHTADAELRITSRFFNTELLELDLTRTDGSRAASWAWRGLRFGFPAELRTAEEQGPEADLATLAALTTLFVSGNVSDPNVVAPPPVSRLDAYPLVPAAPPANPDAATTYDLLLARGAVREAMLLRLHREDARAIDRRGGAYVERHPATPRIAMGLVIGGEFLPDPEGAPRSLGGANLDVLAGARSGRLLFSVTLGLRTGAVDTARFAEVVGVSSVGGAGFTFSAEGRYAIELPLSLEAVLGLQLGARLRFIDVGDWPELDGAIQWGFALAPILGLQIPIWGINDLGSRALLALEGVPEWRFWADPSVSAPAGAESAGARLANALSGQDVGIRVQLGLRLEL